MRYLLSLALAAALGLTSALQAKAVAIMVPQPRQLALQSQVIIVGKVEALEKELIEVAPFPKAPNKVGFQVANVKVVENISGAKGLTSIRVGWQPAPKIDPVPVGPGGGAVPIRPIRRPLPTVNLALGQEGLFFLQKHTSGEFYTLVQWSQPIDKKAENFDKELTYVKKLVKVIDQPMEALQAKEPAERQLAASVLVGKYRAYVPTPDGKPAQQEEIPADQSKLIMRILSEMDWNNAGGAFDPNKLYASQIFYQLGIQQGQDGYTPPKFEQGQDYNKILSEYSTKWLKDNAEKYRIKKFVAEKK